MPLVLWLAGCIGLQRLGRGSAGPSHFKACYCASFFFLHALFQNTFCSRLHAVTCKLRIKLQGPEAEENQQVRVHHFSDESSFHIRPGLALLPHTNSLAKYICQAELNQRWVEVGASQDPMAGMEAPLLSHVRSPHPGSANIARPSTQ